ncbi:hypothetical protein [Streptomyces humi]
MNSHLFPGACQAAQIQRPFPEGASALRLPEEAAIYVMVHGSAATGNDPENTREWVIAFSRDMRGTAGLTTCQVSR